VEAGGRVKTSDGLRCRTFEIGRGGIVEGPIVAEEVNVSAGSRAEDIHGGKIIMEERARADNLYGEEIVLMSHCVVRGEVLYTDSIRIGDKVNLSQEPRKVAELPKPPL
jgi:hypothetical protein